MKRLILLLFFIPAVLTSQNYIDLFKIAYSQNFNNEFEDTQSTTDIHSIDVDLTIPFVINDDNAIVTGVLYSQNNLSLAPGFHGDEAPFYGLLSEKTTLYNTILKLGLATNFNEKWSGTFVVLPKLASDYQDISGEDFYVGGAAILKFQKNENLKYRFGVYAMQQAFGLFTTPLLGFYYLSPDEKLEMNVMLPISVNVNYRLGDTRKVGFDYYAIGRSFDIHMENGLYRYVDYVALEFTGYVEQGFMDNSILLRLKGGYVANSAEVYAKDDQIDFRVSAFDFGDERTQLSPDLSDSLFAKLEAVYRFDLSKQESMNNDNESGL